jgi:hypothetical protein
MKNFAVLEHNMQTKKYIHLQDIMAVDPEEARTKFLKVTNWKPYKELTVLVVKFRGQKAK